MDEKLRAALAEELQMAPEALRPELRLDEIEAWDSTMALTVMVILGDALGVPVEPAEMARLRTIGDIEALARTKRPSR